MFARIENNVVVEYPLTEWDIKSRFPNTSFAVDFANNLPEKYVRVLANSKPVIDEEYYNIVETTPILQDDNWIQSWLVQDKYTPEELDVYEAEKLQNIKTQTWEQVKQIRDDCITAGVEVIVNGESKWFHTDVLSRTQWLGMLLLGNSLPNNISWKTMDNTFVTLTPTIVQDVFQQIQIKEVTTYAYAESLKTSIDSKISVAEVLSIDINSGWLPSRPN